MAEIRSTDSASGVRITHDVERATAAQQMVELWLIGELVDPLKENARGISYRLLPSRAFHRITEYLPETRRLRALAFWLNGGFLEDFEHAIAEGALLNAYQQASDDGARVLILNFSHLEYKNSGIKLLVALVTRANAAGQRLFAVGMNEDYQNIFQVAQLDEGITIYGSEADALQAAHDLLDSPGAPRAASPPRAALPQPTVKKRPIDTWAKPVDRLNMARRSPPAREP